MNTPNEILVVDDDPAHRAMLRTLLGEWGYTVFEADDGRAAIARVRERFFDLILMDVRMLKMSGIEALEKIKAYNPAIPIIIMTAFSSVEAAVDAYLNTPAQEADSMFRFMYETEPHDLIAQRQSMAGGGKSNG